MVLEGYLNSLLPSDVPQGEAGAVRGVRDCGNVQLFVADAPPENPLCAQPPPPRAGVQPPFVSRSGQGVASLHLVAAPASRSVLEGTPGATRGDCAARGGVGIAKARALERGAVWTTLVAMSEVSHEEVHAWGGWPRTAGAALCSVCRRGKE